MPSINTIRHDSVFNPRENNYPIHIIGCGATGSHVFASLVNLGLTKVHCYDFDNVEPHNLANQVYLQADIGKPKVSGCARYAHNKLGEVPEQMTFNNRRVDQQWLTRQSLTGVVFLLTDTMSSRREIFNNLVHCDGARQPTNLIPRGPFLMIETRMASTHGAVYTINPFDKQQADWWLSTLVDDDNPDTTELSPCGTTLSVGTTASILANYAVWQMINHLIDPLAGNRKIDFFLKPTLVMAEAA